MKKTILFCATFWMFSCAHVEKSSEPNIEFSEETEIIPTDFNKNSLSPGELAVQKLGNYVELLRLQHKYPDFNEATSFDTDEFPIDILSKWDSILGLDALKVREAGERMIISDSTERIKLYLIHKENFIVKDSIYAYITKGKILMDGVPKVSSTVTFRKEIN